MNRKTIVTAKLGVSQGRKPTAVYVRNRAGLQNLRGIVMKFSQKTCTLAIATSLSMSALAAGNAQNTKTSPFVAIEDQIYEIKGEISSLQDQIDSIVADVDTIEQRLTADEDAIAILQTSNVSLQILVDNNISSIDDINTAIASLEADLLTLQEHVETNAEAIAAHEALITSLQGSILDIQNGLLALDADLQAQIDHNGTLIAVIESEIGIINSVLEQKQNIIDGVCPSGEQAISEVLADGSVTCTNVNDGGESGKLYTYNVYKNDTIPSHTSVHTQIACSDIATHKAVGLGWNAGIAINKYSQNLAGPYGRVVAYNTGTYTQSISYTLTCAYVAP